MVINHREKEIINFPRFHRDVSPIFDRGSQKVVIETPAKENNTVISVLDFKHLMNEITKISSNFPHRKCALVYKINNNSSLSLEIYPVTDSA